MTRWFSHTAMATRFDLWLCGEDEEHLCSVAGEAWREIDRLEMLMSRHDPRAEIARVNREAHGRPVRIDVELFGILADCRRWFERTGGSFDITAAHRRKRNGKHQPFELDRAARSVRFTEPGTAFDLGGYGKGYAIDWIRTVLEAYRVEAGFIQAGTSSAWALGIPENDSAWTVGLPGDVWRDRLAKPMPLRDRGFSYSATLGEGSDIIDARTGRRLSRPAACWVTAPTALEAEVLSTALLVMGMERAEVFRGYFSGRDLKFEIRNLNLEQVS